MLTDCSGRSISAANIALLWCNVVANIYNLVIISSTEKSEIRALLGEYPEVKQIIVLIQTVVVICAILISNVKKTSCLIFAIKFWVFGSSFALLFTDLLQTWMIGVDLLVNERTLNAFWKAKTHSKESVAPDNLYFTVAVILIIYSVFKFYVTYKLYRLGALLRDDFFADEYYLHEDVELNISNEPIIQSDLPPSYDQCVGVNSETPPPPYSDVQRY